jgi:hypothetical protein
MMTGKQKQASRSFTQVMRSQQSLWWSKLSQFCPASIYKTNSESVVAVHGIGADPDITWTENGLNWLEHLEMLPSALPAARIMRFGYDSRWKGDDAVKQRLSAVSERLLRSLSSVRKVCHRAEATVR